MLESSPNSPNPKYPQIVPKWTSSKAIWETIQLGLNFDHKSIAWKIWLGFKVAFNKSWMKLELIPRRWVRRRVSRLALDRRSETTEAQLSQHSNTQQSIGRPGLGSVARIFNACILETILWDLFRIFWVRKICNLGCCSVLLVACVIPRWILHKIEYLLIWRPALGWSNWA